MLHASASSHSSCEIALRESGLTEREIQSCTAGSMAKIIFDEPLEEFLPKRAKEKLFFNPFPSVS